MLSRARPVPYRSFLSVLVLILSLAAGGCGGSGGEQTSEALPSYCPVSALSAGLPQSAGNDPPIAYRQQLYTDDDTSCDVTFYACDPDQPLTSSGLSWMVDSEPTIGSVTNLSGDYTEPVIQYIPRPGFTGTDSFYYSVSDGVNVSSSKEIRVHIGGNKTLSGLSMEEQPYVADTSAAPLSEAQTRQLTVLTAQAHFTNGVDIDVTDLVTWKYEGEFPPVGSQEIQEQSSSSFLDWWLYMKAYSGPPLPPTTITASYSYGGMSTVSSTTVIFGDTMPPVVEPQPTVTVEATGPATVVELAPPVAWDEISGSDLMITRQPEASFGFDVGTHLVTWFVADAAGNVSTADQIVVVEDTTPPSITADPGSPELPPPGDLTVEATGVHTEVVLSGIAAVDVVDGALAVSSLPEPPFILPLGTTTITWIATDSRGNWASATQNVTVVDTTPPSLNVPADVTAEATGAQTAVQCGSATAMDSVDGVLYPSSNAPALFPLGTTLITWSVSDGAGNVSTAIQSVVVVDTSPPVIDTDDGDPEITPPPDMTVEASGSDTWVDIGTAMAWDIVDGVVTVVNDAPAVFPLGTTTVTWTATDSAGNSATVQQLIAVVDTTPPDIVPPGDVTVTSDGSPVSVEIGSATATDKVDGSVPASSDAPEQFPPGTTVVTWTAEDSSGNTATAAQSVNVVVVLAQCDLEYTGDQVVTVYDDSVYLQATLYPEGGPVSFNDPSDGTSVWFHIFTFEQMNTGSGDVVPHVSVGPVDVSESVLHPGVGVAGEAISLPAVLGTGEENYVVLAQLGEGGSVTGLSQEATLTVYAPAERFFTGGGTVLDGETGEDNSFGFTVKFLDSELGIPVPKGNILYVRQDTVNGLKWRVLSESLEGAGFYPYGAQGGTVAITEGSCRVELYDLFTGSGLEAQSGLDCAMKVEDLDESGIGADTFRLELRYADGVPYDPIHLEAGQMLTGGNVTIHDRE